MGERIKSKSTLLNAEKRGDIPQAKRVQRGQVSIREWGIDDLPSIGKKFGFLKKPEKQLVISTYVQKGGVLKTSSTYTIARTCALHGLNTLIIGLDFECSITDVIMPTNEDDLLLKNVQGHKGLNDFFMNNTQIKDIISKTSIPTLDVIPENHELGSLERWMNRQTRKEYLFKDKLIPALTNYDVIIYDLGPRWDHLSECALTSSNVILMPLACELLAFQSSQRNIKDIVNFQEAMAIPTNNQLIIMYPTLLKRTSMSQQIYAAYLEYFENYVIPKPIRDSVKGEECLVHQQTIFEYAPTSSLAEDYYELITKLFSKLNDFFSTQTHLEKNDELSEVTQ